MSRMKAIAGLSTGLSIATLIGTLSGAISEKAGQSTKAISKPSAVSRPASFEKPTELPSTYLHSWGLRAMDLAEASDLPKIENEEVIVAVIDTGAEVTHPALSQKLWMNLGESGRVDSAQCQIANWKTKPGCDKSTNGIDDDGNGFIDDFNGWNFASNNSDVTDRHGHGTHIAGIIAGVTGDQSNVKVMVLKYYDPKINNEDAIEKTVQAIRYAVQMGAKIINYSAGGLTPNYRERLAIEFAQEHGVTFIAAAGNEASNSDQKPYFPADYDLSNILSVTAFDPNFEVLETSNYGKNSVKIAAPGEDIVSALPKGRFGKMTGTSQATAFASGVAAIVLAANPELAAPERLIEHLVRTGDILSTLENKTATAQKLNAYRALAIKGSERDISGNIIANSESLENEMFVLSNLNEAIIRGPANE